MFVSPLSYLTTYNSNRLYIKRDDLLPFSFGGNKARKALLFFEDFERGGYDCVVTYGTSSSNLCRVVANLCASKSIPCYIISPDVVSEKTANSSMVKMFGAEVSVISLDKVSDTIKKKIYELRRLRKNPYFIPGGGHGAIGTQAYVDCYEEIQAYERENRVEFDYIFFASGTGTTQAGLVAGKLLNHGKENIVGISIARENPRGRHIVIESLREYFANDKVSDTLLDKETIFIDDYVCEGYAETNAEIDAVIREMMLNYGVPLDPVYTGKAFYGMKEYIRKKEIKGKNVLFIHTGGVPLYFDWLKKASR